ncbi:MAG: hypothetical protein HY302_13010 [Opitutae bacterium]|nr:hypothetical protein [Opitutae bacterium]
MESEISYRTDLGLEAGVEAAMVQSDGWVSQREKPFPLTRDPIVVWARFELPLVSAPRPILLNSSAWERAEFFVVRDGRLVDRQLTGTLVPLDERSMHVSMTSLFNHSGFVAVNLEPGRRVTVFARLATSQDYRPIKWLRVYLWDAPDVLAGERRDRIVQGLYLGVMLVLVIYNLGLFVALRERSYLYYVAMELGNAVIWANIFGLTAEFLWPRLPTVEYISAWMLVGANLFAALLFLRSYLHTRQSMPRVDSALRWLAIAGVVAVPIALLASRRDPALGVMIVFLPSFVAFFAAIAVTTLALRRGHTAARHFLAAIACSVSGAMVQTAATVGVLPATDLTLTSAQIGNAAMGIVLSMGLGFRLRHAQAALAEQQIAEARRQSAHEREKREFIEEQSRGLETKVRERTAELAAAREKSDALLANILPQAIIEELKTKGGSEPRRHEDVSILFTDFAGFTEAVATIPAQRLVQELNEIFHAFDEIVTTHGLEKIKTIGDAYMGAAGLPLPAADHAMRAVRAALAMTRFIAARNETAALKWGLRVGVHSGAVVAGIVGKNKYVYDVWGDTVNLASRLESASEANRVNLSAYTYDLVRSRFECEYRSKLAAKGKGAIDMYFVVRETAAVAAGEAALPIP